MKEEIERFKKQLGIVDEETVSNDDFETSVEIDFDDVIKDSDKKQIEVKTEYNALTKGADRADTSLPDIYRRELVPMVTYSDLFTFVIMLCAVITLVISFSHKKQRPLSGKLRRYSYNTYFTGNQVSSSYRHSC